MAFSHSGELRARPRRHHAAAPVQLHSQSHSLLHSQLRSKLRSQLHSQLHSQHHLIIDGPAFVEKGQEIPFDDTHLHFGKAQKEGTVKLSPGEHTLTLQFADAKHRSFGKKFAKRITVVVE